MNTNTRPPVVTVLGHVDHGKTSLLDAIRKTSVTKREAGGITQSIGASVAKTKSGQKITFIDTPGHALFANMRSRGVTIADTAILVVAADDGVQPQTKEAIKLLQESQLPFVVAVTKIDLSTANVETALQSLEKEGVYLEKRGGDISYALVSSKTGEGMDELLELVALVAEMSALKGDINGELEGFVIETTKDKRGLLVSVIIKNGQIKVGDTIYVNREAARIKGIFDSDLVSVKQIGAGYPAALLGFDELPDVGSQISSNLIAEQSQKPIQDKTTQENAKVKIFVKAKTAGSLEALLSNIPDGVRVIGSGVGDVIESDIFLAKAGAAKIFLFEAKFASSIRKLAETESVKMERFEIVYDLIERLKELVDNDKVEVLGQAQILASFPFNGKKVAGCKITQGVFKKGDHVKLMRAGKEVGVVRIISIRKQKVEALEVKQGEECGILMLPQLDFASGDMVLSVT